MAAVGTALGLKKRGGMVLIDTSALCSQLVLT